MNPSLSLFNPPSEHSVVCVSCYQTHFLPNSPNAVVVHSFSILTEKSSWAHEYADSRNEAAMNGGCMIHPGGHSELGVLHKTPGHLRYPTHLVSTVKMRFKKVRYSRRMPLTCMYIPAHKHVCVTNHAVGVVFNTSWYMLSAVHCVVCVRNQLRDQNAV